jgi:sulfofructose kinase
MATTAAAQAARLGCRSHLLSLVGDDPEGRVLVASLRRLGVGTRRLQRSPQLPTTVAHVLVDRRSGDRRFIVADRRAIERAAPAFDLTPIRPGAVLLVDGHFSANALRAAKRARDLGVPVVGDFADARPANLRVLRHVDHPIVPRSFVRAWGRGSSRDTLRALGRVCPGTPVVTEGAAGALALIGGRVVRIPPHRVRVRDTTGAGDAFHGAFAAALAHGANPREALQAASRAAAAVCTALGGTAGLIGPEKLPGTVFQPGA